MQKKLSASVPLEVLRIAKSYHLLFFPTYEYRCPRITEIILSWYLIEWRLFEISN